MKYLIALLCTFAPALALAADKPSPEVVAIDTLWVVCAGVLVFFMQAGFAMFEMGLHSEKNTVNILMKNVCDFVMASLCFWAVGFALMFGDGNSLLGTSGWFLNGDAFSSLSWSTVPIGAKFFFQLVFAGTTATIVSGAIGGRVKFSTYLLLSFVLISFIYPIQGHWVWGGGWLAERGFFDFAGSTVVHAVGGFAALAAALVVGPRLGRFNDDGSVNILPGFNMSYVGLGVLILWLGWFGFNPGSTMGMVGSGELVAHIFLTTNLSAAAGAMVAMALAWKHGRKADVSMTLNGVLAGLVSITAPCAFVTPFGAVAIGAVGGAVVFFGCILVDKLRVDDAVGAFPVHGLCGLWGTMAIGLFSAAPWGGGSDGPALGLFYGGGASQLWVQTYGVLTVSAVTFVSTYLVCTVLNKFFGLRVSEAEEREGLDLVEHGHKGYYHTLLNEEDASKDDRKKAA